MGISVIRTSSSEGSLLPYFYWFWCHYHIITYLSGYISFALKHFLNLALLGKNNKTKIVVLASLIHKIDLKENCFLDCAFTTVIDTLYMISICLRNDTILSNVLITDNLFWSPIIVLSKQIIGDQKSDNCVISMYYGRRLTERPS